MLSCHSLCTWNEPLRLCWTLEKSCIFLYLYNQKKESRRWLLGMREAVVLWFDGEWSLQTYYALTQAQISALTKPTEQYVLGTGSRVLWHPGTRRPGLLGRASCNPACREIWGSQHECTSEWRKSWSRDTLIPLLLEGSSIVLEARAEGRAREGEQMSEGERRSIKLINVILCSLEDCKLEHIPTSSRGQQG